MTILTTAWPVPARPHSTDTLVVCIAPSSPWLSPPRYHPHLILHRFGTTLPIISRARSRLLLAMLARSPDHINPYDALWADDESGGPLTSLKAVQVQIHHLRQQVASMGIQISTRTGQGYGATVHPHPHTHPISYSQRGIRIP